MTEEFAPDSSALGPLAKASTPSDDLERPLDDPRALQILTAGIVG